MIDVVSAGKALFSKSGLAIGSELVAFLLACMEAISHGREVFIGLGVE